MFFVPYLLQVLSFRTRRVISGYMQLEFSTNRAWSTRVEIDFKFLRLL